MSKIPGSADNITFTYNDIAPIGCNDCSGCEECCHEMGDTIIQDPYDMWDFCTHMKIAGGGQVTFDLLISDDGPWELSEHDYMLLPNLKMVDDGRCSFLGPNGRCTIHSIRSGLCRLYPLGRLYTVKEAPSEHSDDMSNMHSPSEVLSYYILDSHLGCQKIINKSEHTDISSGKVIGTPIKISDWLGYPNPEKYEIFLLSWHSVKNDMRQFSNILSTDDLHNMQELLLRVFYETPYAGDFYTDFNNRMKIWAGVRDAAFSAYMN